jgi:glycosyltransferase involved in cell wall biosynthesis
MAPRSRRSNLPLTTARAARVYFDRGGPQSPEEFADERFRLLKDDAVRDQMATAALHMVEMRILWERIARDFEEILLEVA